MDEWGKLEEPPAFVLSYRISRECIMKVSLFHNQVPSHKTAPPLPQSPTFSVFPGKESKISSIRIGIERDINKARGRQ